MNHIVDVLELIIKHKLYCSIENLNTMNKAALSEFAEYAITAAAVFQEKIPHKGAKFLGNASMRDKENGNIAWMSKRGVHYCCHALVYRGIAAPHASNRVIRCIQVPVLQYCQVVPFIQEFL